MSQLRIFGIGSPFGDDQVGMLVANILRENLCLNGYSNLQLEVIAQDRPGVRLLDLMQGAKIVFIIDAIKTGAPLGTIHCYRNHEINCVKNNISSHSLNLGEVYSLGKILNQIPETLVLYGIEIDEIGFSTKISKKTQKAANILANTLVYQTIPDTLKTLT